MKIESITSCKKLLLFHTTYTSGIEGIINLFPTKKRENVNT